MKCDVLVIGGGIIGAAVAHEAATRGLETILLEKGDFGSQTSAGSFKIIHGGLRYLQHLNFKRVIESADEQKYLRSCAPNLLSPLPFIVPCYGRGLKGKGALHIACSLYEGLARSRNHGLPSQLHIPNHKLLSASELKAIAPLLPETQGKARLQGAVVFYDCQMRNPDRLTLAVVRSAEAAGAKIFNYTEVSEIESEKKSGEKGESNHISRVSAKDRITGKSLSFSPRYVVNACGPWAERVGSLFNDKSLLVEKEPPLYFSKGIQLVVPEIVGTYALSVQSKGLDTDAVIKRGGRAFFLQPWRGMTLIGTSDTLISGATPEFSISLSEIREMLLEVKSAYPSQFLEPVHVRYAFGGLRAASPAAVEAFKRSEKRDGMVNTTREEILVDHSRTSYWGGLVEPIDNLVSIVGVKYTTFRKVGEEVLNLLGIKNPNWSKSRTKNLQLFACPLASEINQFVSEVKSEFTDIGVEFEEDELDSLIHDYGTEAITILKEVSDLIHDRAMDPEDALLLARIRYAFRYEHARTLEDLVLRRLPDSATGFPGPAYLSQVGKLAAQELSWTSDYLEFQTQRVLGAFRFE